MPIGNTGNHKQIYVEHLHFLFFFGNLGNRLAFMCSAPIVKYKFHSRVPNTQEILSYVIDFYVSADVLFSNFD